MASKIKIASEARRFRAVAAWNLNMIDRQPDKTGWPDDAARARFLATADSLNKRADQIDESEASEAVARLVRA